MLGAYRTAHLVHDIDREGSVRDDIKRKSVIAAHEDASSVILMWSICSPDGVDAELIVLLCRIVPCMDQQLATVMHDGALLFPRQLRPTFLERHGVR